MLSTFDNQATQSPPTGRTHPASATRDVPTGAARSPQQTQISPGRWLLHCQVTVPRPREQVFSFFERAENLNELTPPWLDFRILTPTPILVRPGAIIDYRIVLKGFPMRWRTLIKSHDPPRGFVDEQLRGPYRVWHHTHEFDAITLADGRDATVVTDRVQYELRWPARTGPLARLIRSRLVAPDLDRIFSYRTLRMTELFGPP